MKKHILFLSLALLVSTPVALVAQTTTDPQSRPEKEQIRPEAVTLVGGHVKKPVVLIKPLSHIALGGGISTQGVNMQVATNLSKNFNLRGTGNLLNYTVNNITTNGFNVDAKLNFASAGASLDMYPWATHGFRISPGALFYNKNEASALFTVQGGTSFTLDNITYYASSSDPVQGTGLFSLHKQSPAFSITTGWGNMVPRKGGHWSFPFELGVAFTGVPSVNVALTSGQACDVSGLNCVDVATDPTVQTNLQAQIAKYQKDLDPLKMYPIVTFGVAYSFGIR